METTRQDQLDSLYEEDFYTWTQHQAALLRAGAFDRADVPHIIEEIETLGRSEINALRSRYGVLCAHLLKVIVQAERASRSWTLTIAEQRVQIARILQDNPGLKAKRTVLFQEGYEDGRKLAAADTALAITSFAATPPFTIDQAETDGWLPDPASPSDPTPTPSR